MNYKLILNNIMTKIRRVYKKANIKLKRFASKLNGKLEILGRAAGSAMRN